MKNIYQTLEADNYLYIDSEELLSSNIRQLLVLAQAFFDQEQSVKDQFNFGNIPTGYRNIGIEYAQNSDNPDLNESFAFRKIDQERLKIYPQLQAFTDQLAVVQGLLDEIAQSVLDDIAKHLNQQNVLSTDNYGWLQINYYQPSTQTRTFLMDEHEDGTLLTLVTATEKGLEFRTDDNRSGSISGDLNKLLIMPSEVLTLLTANKIKPLYHRVRNHPEIEKRFSVIYFVIPNERHYIAPWIENEFNQHIDIAKRSIENSLRYGLPTQ
ncbi:MAG: hypothetical protein RL637_1296 [Pseudomonadota bacterium]|jgi:isopenicillin N synthase-like dioxygenase